MEQTQTHNVIPSSAIAFKKDPSPIAWNKQPQVLQARITKILDGVFQMFNKKSGMILTEMEDMKKEFIQKVESISECLSGSQKEFKLDNFPTSKKLIHTAISNKTVSNYTGINENPNQRESNEKSSIIRNGASCKKGKRSLNKKSLTNIERPKEKESSNSLIAVKHSEKDHTKADMNSSTSLKILNHYRFDSITKSKRQNVPPWVSRTEKVLDKRALINNFQQGKKKGILKDKKKTENGSGFHHSTSKSENDNSHWSIEDAGQKETKEPKEKVNEKEVNFQDSQIKINSNVPSLPSSIFPIIEQRKFSILDVDAYPKEALNSTIIEHFRKDALSKIQNKYIKAFFIMANNELVPLEERLNFAFVSKKILSHLSPMEIIKTSLIANKKRIKALEEIKCPTENLILSDEKIAQYQKLLPSKTAQSGLNFFTKQSESSLHKDTSPQVQALYELIHLLCGEETPTKEYSSETIFQYLLPKFGISCLKQLFFSVIFKNVQSLHNFSQEHKDRILQIIDANKCLISPNEALKINKSLSYLTFSIKEIYEYLMTGNENRIHFYQSKILSGEIKKLKRLNEKVSVKFHVV